jgi:hypothetical protein
VPRDLLRHTPYVAKAVCPGFAVTVVEFPRDAVSDVDRDMAMEADASATTMLADALSEELYVKVTVPDT